MTKETVLFKMKITNEDYPNSGSKTSSKLSSILVLLLSTVVGSGCRPIFQTCSVGSLIYIWSYIVAKVDLS